MNHEIFGGAGSEYSVNSGRKRRSVFENPQPKKEVEEEYIKVSFHFTRNGVDGEGYYHTFHRGKDLTDILEQTKRTMELLGYKNVVIYGLQVQAVADKACLFDWGI